VGHRSLSLLALVAAQAGCSSPPSAACLATPPTGLSFPFFHGDRSRAGWNDAETALTPTSVASGKFGLRWSSPVFDTGTLDGGGVFAGRMFASPIYADGIPITAGPAAGKTLSIVFGATVNGGLYAVNAFDGNCVPAGTILWKAQLGVPASEPYIDSRPTPLGILSTPALDSSSFTLYAAAIDQSSGSPVWKVFAVDARSGAIRAGWPLVLDPLTVEAQNTNGEGLLAPDATRLAQRAGLVLSPDNALLYVSFGGFADLAGGWMVAVDTRAATVAASFASGVQVPDGVSNGGMWGSGGAAIDTDGTIYMTTGNGPASYGPMGVMNAWGDSLLSWTPNLAITGSYSPWNYCLDDLGDADLAAERHHHPAADRLRQQAGHRLPPRARHPPRLADRPPRLHLHPRLAGLGDR
jgi:hypothetical protein